VQRLHWVAIGVGGGVILEILELDRWRWGWWWDYCAFLNVLSYDKSTKVAAYILPGNFCVLCFCVRTVISELFLKQQCVAVQKS
jgi:hypothetical protein